MNSFRIVDTKFRILKGGKIGLSLSISLIGGMLVFSSVNAHATDYFTDVQSTLGTSTNTSGYFDITVQTAVNSGILSSTRTESSNDDIIFKPTSWATTSYSSADFVNDVDNIPTDGIIDYSQYTIISESASLPQLTLTFDSGANAANISKNSLLKYDTTASGTVDINSNTTYNLNSASSSLYTANIIFTGSNIISGTTNIDDGNIKLNGSATFTGDVTAGTIDIDTTDTIIFNSNVTGDIITSVNDKGIVTTTGITQTITGNIGSSVSQDLNTLNIGSATDTSYSSTTINGDVFANSTILNNNATTNNSSLILTDGSDITSTITTSDNNMGILTLLGTSTVSGAVGTDTKRLKEINAGVTGKEVIFNDMVHALNLFYTGNGTVVLNGDNSSDANIEGIIGTVDLASTTGTLEIGDDVNITIGTAGTQFANANNGTLKFNGNSTITGVVGGGNTTENSTFKNISAGANGKTVTFVNDVNATNLEVSGTGTVDLNGNYTGTALRYNADGKVILADGKNITSTITTAANDTGTLTLEGTSTVSGAVGTNTNRLKEINAGTAGETVTFSSDVYATNLDVEGTGTVDLNGNYTGTALRYNADGKVILADGKNITSTITTAANDTGTLTLEGTSTVSGAVGTDTKRLKEINAGADGKTVTFNNDVYATNLAVSGTGTVDLNGNYTGTNLNYNSDGKVILTDGSDITSTITTSDNNMGILTLLGTSTVSGAVGTDTKRLKEINAGVTGKKVIFNDMVHALNLFYTGNGTVVLNGDISSDANIEGIIGTVNLASTTGTLEIGDGVNITTGTSGTQFVNANDATLKFNGNSTITGVVGGNTSGNSTFAKISAGADGKIVTFNDDVYATNLAVSGTGTVDLNGNYTGTNLNYNSDGKVILADGKNITSTITTTTNDTGTLTLEGTSTISGAVGTDTKRLKEINAGAIGKTVIFNSDVYATNLDVEGIGTVDLNGNYTGTALRYNADGKVILADGKNITSTITTAANNTGILNYKGDGIIDGTVGSLNYGIKELNVNTNNEQDKDSNNNVITQGLLANREIFADIINLEANATLTLADNANITNTGSDNLVIATDNEMGKLVFEGNSTINGEIGESNKVLNTINAGVTGKEVIFNDMVHALNLFYTGNGTVVLNGDISSDANIEGIIGSVDLASTTGTLEIGDDVNITTGTSGTQFVNANNATLTFGGNSTITGVVGGNTSGKSTFKEIQAGKNSDTVTFNDDVYALEKFLISGNGIVNLKGDLYSDLVFAQNGTVNVDDGKSIKESIRTENTGDGNINFKGTTTLYDDIGTNSVKIASVTFASSGSSTDTYTQNIDKNIYATNTYIGNGSNKTTVNILKDTTFGGNLDLTNNSSLKVSDYDVIVTDNLNIASNTALYFKVYTTDISGGEAVENPKSGSITANNFTMANDTKIYINYDGSWYGAGQYNLINSTNATTNYYGTEVNGLVSDNSIIDSVIKKDGNNLTLFADRTGGGSYNAEDLYIVKSDIGKDYSNKASNSLANYANKTQREGALAEIIRRMEELDGGLILSNAKKEELVKTQRLLAPIANNSNIQTSLSSSNLTLSTINGRLSNIRTTQSTPNTLNNQENGLSSGEEAFDSSFWIKAMGSKATQDKIKEYDGFNSTTYGLVTGIDKIFNNDSIFGLALAYSTTNTDQDNLSSDSSDTKSIQVTAYTSKEFGDAYIDGYLSYARHSTDAIRTANSGKLASTVNADQISAKVESGYKFILDDNTSLTPFASLEYNFLNQKAYTEKGTTYQNDALKVDNLELNKGTVALGTKLTTKIELEDILIIPQFSASVYNSFGDNNVGIKAQFVGAEDKFVTPVQELNKTMYNVGLGIETKLSETTSLLLDVDYDRSSNGSYEGYSGSLTFGVKF